MLMGGELCFALSTVFTKYVTSTSPIPAVETTFFRFFFGFWLALFYILHTKGSFKAARWDLVFWRGLLNTIAVILFFMSVEHTTVTNANMLNMTYPAFLFLTAPFINKEKSSPGMLVFLVLTMVGIFLVIRPDFHHVRVGDLYGLLSGIVAAFGVAVLRKAREFDSAATILFYLMGLGTILNFLVMLPVFVMPYGMPAVHLVISALFGVLGQSLMTSGYLHVSARGGGLVSSSRIFFAAVLGIVLFHEVLTPRIALGGSCILASIVGVTLLMREENKKPPAPEELT